jgi:Protein of unknown function (DUF4231)
MSADLSDAALDPSSASASVPPVDATAARVPSDAELEERRAAALADWEEQVKFFRGSAKTSHRLLRLSQVLIIVLSAITPLILLADVDVLPFFHGITPEEMAHADARRRLIAAVLSAVVAIVAGLNGAFRWAEEWVRSAYYRERLTSERYTFLTAATPEYAGQKQDAIAAFGRELADIRMDEVTEFKEAKKSEIVAWLAAQDQLTTRTDRNDHQPGQPAAELGRGSS